MMAPESFRTLLFYETDAGKTGVESEITGFFILFSHLIFAFDLRIPKNDPVLKRSFPFYVQKNSG